MEVQDLTPRCGAEVLGADVRALSDDEVARLGVLLAERGVVVLRDQELDDTAQRAFAARLGTPFRFRFGSPVSESVPEVHPIATDGSRGDSNRADVWHSDATFMARPPMATVLRAVQLPPAGGDTLFASMDAAYELLSPPVRGALGAGRGRGLGQPLRAALRDLRLRGAARDAPAPARGRRAGLTRQPRWAANIPVRRCHASVAAAWSWESEPSRKKPCPASG